ncbi:MAG: M23 family metallopeptidase [Treponema sp.]|jgi:hypothetical protein|nr:M23 family metallopeptidase [Treponema sp.]
MREKAESWSRCVKNTGVKNTGVKNAGVKAAALMGMILRLGGGLSAIDWPVTDAAIYANFGENDQGRPFLGAAFESEGPIYACETGDVLFTHDPARRSSRLPSPLGAWVALDHGDGIISIYSRFDDAQNVSISGVVEKGQYLASAGQTGWSERQGFSFSFFDRKERRWVNPSMLITPQEDTAAPVIASVELKDSGGKAINPLQVRSISQGRYVVSVTAWDTLRTEQEQLLAPYRIRSSINGLEAGELKFDTFSARDGILMVYCNGLVPVQRIYGAYPAYETGEVWLTRGQATLEILVQDISGNSKSATYKLQIE